MGRAAVEEEEHEDGKRDHARAPSNTLNCFRAQLKYDVRASQKTTTNK